MLCLDGGVGVCVRGGGGECVGAIICVYYITFYYIMFICIMTNYHMSI
jgi:hypothetical protein